MPILIFGIVIAVIIVGALSSRRRRLELEMLAAKLGLRFSPDKDRSMDGRFGFLSALKRGSQRYAYNVFSGNYRGHAVLAFDYHYAVRSNKQTNHYHFSFLILFLPIRCPELTIVREGIFSKIVQAVGFDDIDFESAEFSRRYCVRSKDKKFAYDVCNAQMIAYLLDSGDLNVEIEENVVALKFSSRLSPADLRANLDRLIHLRSLLPNYLFDKEPPA